MNSKSGNTFNSVHQNVGSGCETRFFLHYISHHTLAKKAEFHLELRKHFLLDLHLKPEASMIGLLQVLIWSDVLFHLRVDDKETLSFVFNRLHSKHACQVFSSTATHHFFLICNSAQLMDSLSFNSGT